MQRRLESWSARQWARAILVAAVIGLIAYVIWRAGDVLVPFLLGALVAYVVLPLVDWLDRNLARLLRRRRGARGLAILIVYVVSLGLIAGFIVYIVPIVVGQVQQLIANREAIASEIQSRLAGLREWYERNVPLGVQQLVASQLESLRARLVSEALGAVSAAVAAIGSTLAALFGFLVVPFWLIYVFFDAGRFRRGLLGLLPEGVRPDAVNIGRLFDDVVVAYVRGQLIVAALAGSLTGLGLALIGVDFPALLGLITAIGDLIPTLGPILAAIPAVIIAALERPTLALWAILVLVGMEQVESLFLGPRVVGDAVRLRPAVIIVLLVVAGRIWGFIGLLLVVPVAAYLRDVIRYLRARTAPEPASPDGALHQVRVARRGD